MNRLHESVWATIAAQDPRAAAALAATSRTGRNSATTAAARARISAIRVAKAWRAKIPHLAIARAMRDAGTVLKTPAGAARDRVMHRLGFVAGTTKTYSRAWRLFVHMGAAVLSSADTFWTFTRDMPPDGMTSDAQLNRVVRRAWDVVFGTSRTNAGPFRFERYGARLNATTLLPAAAEYRRLVEPPRPARKAPRLATLAARKAPPR